MIELDGVSFDYIDFKGKVHPLLEDISFCVDEHERVVLMGVNGSGKSTLMKIIDALIFPKKGIYRYNGEKIDKKSIKKLSRKFRKEVVFLMQDPNLLLFNATVREEIAFGLHQFGFDQIERRVEEIAERFSLSRYLEIPPFSLSGGEKQRVALAALLVIEPKVLLMDEPTANLDPVTTGWLIDLLNDMKLTTIISTHNLSLAQELGDRILTLNNKHQIIYDGDIQNFVQDKELLIEARLMHKHKHTHDDKVHSHYHLHEWD